MARLSDEIEAYLRQLLGLSANGSIEIQRSELADRFDCVPSQITYVLMTRFTSDRGFLVEGRRGGGGGIRLTKLPADRSEIAGLLAKLDGIDQARAQNMVYRLYEEGFLSEREAALMQAAIKREVLQIELPERDRIRARLLKAMLHSALKPEEGG